MDSEQMAAAGEEVRTIFKAVDSEHPAVKALIRLSVLHRVKHPATGRPALKPPDGRAPKPVSSQATLTRLDRVDIKLPEVPALVFELNEIISDPMSSGADIAQMVNKSPNH